MKYKKSLSLFILVFSLMGCTPANTILNKEYSKVYHVYFEHASGPYKNSYRLREDPTIELDKLTVYHENYDNKIVKQFHIGDKITIYYWDKECKNIKLCTVNKVESVAIYLEANRVPDTEEWAFTFTYFVLDQNFKYNINLNGSRDTTYFVDGDVNSYVWGQSSFADNICFAVYQEDEIINNTIDVIAVYETPIYY